MTGNYLILLNSTIRVNLSVRSCRHWYGYRWRFRTDVNVWGYVL